MFDTTDSTDIPLNTSAPHATLTRPASPADRVKDITAEMIKQYREAERNAVPGVKHLTAVYESLSFKKTEEKVSEKHEKKSYLGDELGRESEIFEEGEGGNRRIDQ